MKINKYLSIIALGVLSLSSCSKDFNDQFDGLDKKTEITDVKKKGVEYTLTNGNYETISEMEANIAIAERDDEQELLAAIKTEHGFHSKDDAAKYVPAFISSLDTWRYLSAGSKLEVYYTLFNEIPANVAAMRAMKSYTLKAEDYAAVADDAESWYATPETEENIAAVLPTDGYADGDYVAVSYKYFEGASDSGSVPGPTPAEDPEQAWQYGDGLKDVAVNETVSTVGVITAVCTQGVILSDNSGSILLYYRNDPSNLELGDVVSVSGKVTAYNKGFQLDNTNENITSVEKLGKAKARYGEAMELDGAKMDELLTRVADELCIFVKVTGTPSISGNYVNFNVAGAETAQGSIYNATDEVKAWMNENAGKEVTFYGFMTSISVSGGAPKFVNVIVTHIGGEVPAQAFSSVLGKAAIDEEVAIHGYVSAVSTYGPVVTDASGSMLLYKGGTEWEIGDILSVDGKIAAYSTGFQIDASAATSKVTKGNGSVIPYYGEPVVVDADKLRSIMARTENEYAYYCTATAKVVVSGNYINLYVDGEDTNYMSFYGLPADQKAGLVEGKTITFTGYVSATNTKTGYANVVLIEYADAVATTSSLMPTRAAAVEDKYAVYKYNGSAFEPADVTVLQPADYAAMGLGTGFASDVDTESVLLPKYLKNKYTYASEGESVYVSYRKGASWTTDEYTFDGSDWNKTEYTVKTSSRFRKLANGSWDFDSTYEIDFTTIGQTDLKEFQQYCANWVYDNIDFKLGAPERDNAGVILSTDAITVGGNKPAGEFFVSNYGNNEWYAGTYAYYGEMNWNAFNAETSFKAAAKAIDLDPSIDVDLGMDLQALVNENYDKKDVVKAMQMNAAKVFKHVLEAMYPNFTPDDYSAIVINIINYYERSEHDVFKAVYTYTFNVVGKGEYEFDPESFGIAE